MPALNGLQIMRGIAAGLVVWHHALEEAEYVRYGGAPPDWLIRIGAAGVDIFFVISGFIMMYTSFAPNKACPTPAQFVWRRFLRIYPLYWICCGLILALRALGFFNSAEVAPDYVANSLLLLPLRSKLLLTPAWTLVYEIYFYLLFAIALRGHNARTALCGTSASLGVLYVAGHWCPTPELYNFFTSEIAFEFCFGLLIGYIVTRCELPRFLRFAWMPAAAVALVATSLRPSNTTASLATDGERLIVWGVPATFIVLSAIYWLPDLKRRVVRIALLLGDASYAVYLTHSFVMITYAVLLRKLPSLTSASQWPVTTAICLAALTFGTLVHLTLEKALMRLTHAVRMRRVGAQL